MELIALIMGIVISATIGVLIARARKREPATGAALGCFLGPIGWLILALMSEEEPAKPIVTRRKCPFCAEAIWEEALVCRYCGKSITGSAAGDGPKIVGGIVIKE